MHIKHLTSQQYVISRWSGGTTTQLAIAPESALYQDHDFLWRISSAQVELECSTFTPLPDYNRAICVLQGEMRLRHNGGETHSLSPYRVHPFDGGAETVSEGRCTDFNLMTRKGVCLGSLEAVVLQSGEPQQLAAIHSDETLVVYCAQGHGRLHEDAEVVRLAAGESALITQLSQEGLTLAGEGDFLLARIWE